MTTILDNSAVILFSVIAEVIGKQKLVSPMRSSKLQMKRSRETCRICFQQSEHSQKGVNTKGEDKDTENKTDEHRAPRIGYKPGVVLFLKMHSFLGICTHGGKGSTKARDDCREKCVTADEWLCTFLCLLNDKGDSRQHASAHVTDTCPNIEMGVLLVQIFGNENAKRRSSVRQSNEVENREMV